MKAVPRPAPSARTLRYEDLVLRAYDAALGDLGPYRCDPAELARWLGDVDAQAGHAEIGARLGVAGRVLAAAQATERVRLPAGEVRALVEAWLVAGEIERDDAGPAPGPHVSPELERVDGFGRALGDGVTDGVFGRAAWAVAAAVLQHLIRPAVDVARGLALREALQPLAASALAHARATAPADAGAAAHVAPAAAALDACAAAAVLAAEDGTPAARRAAWLRIAAGAARANRRLSGGTLERAMDEALERAAGRLAASLVPEEPARFRAEPAAEHAVQAAYDAAVTALGTAVRPSDPVFSRSAGDVRDSLVEAAGSGLIGAWVETPAA